MPSAMLATSRRPLLCLASVTTLLSAVSTAAPNPVEVPNGFVAEVIADGFDRPVAVAPAPDGRLFVAEQRGMVWVIDPVLGRLPDPFLDLRDEVQISVDRGMIGLALDPQFLQNRRVYVSYTIDAIFGRPEDEPYSGTGGRLTRYTGTEESGGNVADPKSRFVLIGDVISNGPPTCWPSHSVGALHFGFDGSLFMAAGDGATYSGTDAGGLTPDCFAPGLFGPEEDIGSFRAQSHESLAGKILRLDPETGAGLPDNPFYDGDPYSKASRIWVTGLRNPFRYALRPGTPSPATLYVGDVQAGATEELDVLVGGDNAGWPCYDAPFIQWTFFLEKVPAYGCDTLETPSNPGTLVQPTITWNHGNPDESMPPGVTCSAIVAGAFYDGCCFPGLWQGRLFHADYLGAWVRAAAFDDDANLIDVLPFITDLGHPVDIQVDPTTSALIVVSLDGQVWAIRYQGADLNNDGVVDGGDLAIVLAGWGTAGPLGDLDGSGSVDAGDVGVLLANWTG
ncbi:MAG: PQQ-dependent sugar dehydrogenase [Phycisphaerales bacterium]